MVTHGISLTTTGIGSARPPDIGTGTTATDRDGGATPDNTNGSATVDYSEPDGAPRDSRRHGSGPSGGTIPGALALPALT
eukprot:3371677-Lingulodinium_polyedra.AAC.1